MRRRSMPNDSTPRPIPAGARRTAPGSYEFDFGGEVGRILAHDGAWGGFNTVVLGRPGTPRRRRGQLYEPHRDRETSATAEFDTNLLTAWIGSN